MGGLLVVLALPITILLTIDASRILKTQPVADGASRRLGIILGIPQGIMGTVLIAFGLVYPFFGVRKLAADLQTGRAGSVHLIMLVTSIAFLFVGYHYLREGLALNRKRKGE